MRIRLRRPRHDVDATIPREDRYGLWDLLAEATSDIGTRPSRLVLTVAGTILGIGSLVATLGFAHTSAVQIAQQFETANTAQAVVRPVETAGQDGVPVPVRELPWDAAERISQLNGVEAAAVLAEVATEQHTIAAVQVQDPSAVPVSPPAIVAASGGFLDAVQGSLITGRAFDAGHDLRGDRVVMLGVRAAERLGIDRVDTLPSLFIDGRPYAVIGIFDELTYRAELLDAVVLPVGTARADLGIAAPDEVQVRVVPKGGPVVGPQLPLAVAPDAPDTVEVLAATATSQLQEGVLGDLNVILLIVSLIVLLAGGVGIASVTTLTVMERRGEIGLRRALGATARQIASQFMTESVLLGAVGGVIGAAVGVAAVIAVALVQGWAPVTDPLIAVVGVAVGPIIGLLAGWIPAVRAARIEPVSALRDD